MTRSRGIVVTLAIALCMLARPLYAADWLLTPMVGATLGGATGFFDVDATAGNPHRVYVLSVMCCGDGVLGLDGEGMLAPSFFSGGQLVESSLVTGASVSAIIRAPRRLISRVRPYALIGAGLVRASSADVRHVFEIDSTLPAFHAGGGVVVPISRRLGVRTDARFIRTSSSRSDGALGTGEGFLEMWRIAAGVSWSP